MSVAVKIDQAGQNVFARRVDIKVALLRPSRPALTGCHRIEANDLPDDIILDDNIVRPSRRLSASIDDGCAANDDPLEPLPGKARRIGLAKNSRYQECTNGQYR